MTGSMVGMTPCSPISKSQITAFGSLLCLTINPCLSIKIDMNTIEQTDEFEAWLDGLNDRIAQKAIARHIVKMQGGLFGDWKSVGEKVAEARFDIGPGYRVYYTRTGNTIYLLLAGGTKKTQSKDIRKAEELAALL